MESGFEGAGHQALNEDGMLYVLYVLCAFFRGQGSKGAERIGGVFLSFLRGQAGTQVSMGGTVLVVLSGFMVVEWVFIGFELRRRVRRVLFLVFLVFVIS